MAREYETIEEATQSLTEEDENILLWSAIGATAAVDIFAARIESEILRLRQANIGDAEILRILNNDFTNRGRIFGEFSNNLRRGVVSGIMQGSRFGQDEVYGNSVRFRWVSVGSSKICVDCQDRVGRIESWESWEAIGLPATGFSICKEFCYCQLVPEDIEIDDRVVI
jgi:hypothetical protein|tara:strand:+ start:356 stop:859 length:504 start_codon:yes stop_codon:yes gene_type:complete